MFKIGAYINYTWFPPSELLLIWLQRSHCSMLYVHWACFCKLLIAHCQLWTLTVPDLVVWWYTQVRSGLRLWKSGKHFNLQPAIRNIFSSLARAVNMLASVFKQLICHTQLRKMIAGIHLGTWYMTRDVYTLYFVTLIFSQMNGYVFQKKIFRHIDFDT